mmetsp:Transcript_4062/g.4517  ORF Transcript_4062/g.4517 Transcript_4062/m.4517 type:complete len:87 (-) Transcript_4062:944-1204(-)
MRRIKSSPEGNFSNNNRLQIIVVNIDFLVVINREETVKRYDLRGRKRRVSAECHFSRLKVFQPHFGGDSSIQRIHRKYHKALSYYK